LRESREQREEEMPNKLYADVAHPINQSCRDLIQARVVEEYALELERAKQPGYVSRYDDSYEGHELAPPHARTSEAKHGEAKPSEPKPTEAKPGVPHERETSVPPPHIGLKPTTQPDTSRHAEGDQSS
jgi:stage V sporulation protein G